MIIFATKIITDAFIIIISLISAFTMKFKLKIIYQWIFNEKIIYPQTHDDLNQFLKFNAIIISLWLLILLITDSYKKFNSIMPYIDESIKIIKANIVAITLIAAITFFYPIIPQSKTIMIYLFFISNILLILNHLIINIIEKKIKKEKQPHYLIIGSYENSEKFILNQLITNNSSKYVGSLCNENPKIDSIHPTIKPIFKKIGSISQAQTNQTITTIKPQEIIVTDNINNNDKKHLIKTCKNNNISLKIKLPHTQELETIEIIEQELFESFITKKIQSPLLKTIFDKITSLFALLLLSPILITISLFILITSGRPIIYKQERVGKNNKKFIMYKFRTLEKNAEKKSGPIYINNIHSPAYNKSGKFLRETSLDELPQLINILKGEMSLVGPRPERPIFVKKLQEEIPNYKLRHTTKGGVTGWAQINGRSFLTLNPKQKTHFDLYYIQNQTFILDIKIILKTISQLFHNEKN